MAQQNQFSIGAPLLSWDGRGVPYSDRVSDIYYSQDNGVAESEYVFLSGIEAPEVWLCKKRFVIGELGFGTGLNFFITWAKWRETAPPGSSLHYVGIEGFPLQPFEILRAMRPFPQLLPLAKELVESISPVHQGYQLVHLEKNRVILNLFLGPIGNILSGLTGTFDAWYLDGFTPTKNPEMWTPNVFKELARLSQNLTRVATFTASSNVRKGLTSVGFNMAKRPGFGAKRECLFGKFIGSAAKSNLRPYFRLREPISGSSRIAVIGGGVAGSAIANFLELNGANVSIYEQNANLASEGSGNPAVIIQPRISDSASPTARFQTDAYLTAVKTFESLKTGFVGQRGAISIGRNEETLARHLRHLREGALPKGFADILNKADLSDKAGIDIPSAGVLHPQAGMINPLLVCKEFLERIECRFNIRVEKIKRTASEWVLYSKSNQEVGRAEVIILANSIGSIILSDWCNLHLTAKRGSVSFVEPSPHSKSLRCSISYGGYVTPALIGPQNRYHIMGATFDQISSKNEQKYNNDADMVGLRNYKIMLKRSEELSKLFSTKVLGGRSAVRATTSDHLPVVGPLFLEEEFVREFIDIRHGRFHKVMPSSKSLNEPEGLYVFSGLGSHGFSLANHTASLLGAQMLGLPIPADRKVVEGVHPSRFLIRDLKRGRIKIEK